MPYDLSQTMNDRCTAPALPQAIDVPKPSFLQSAFSLRNKDQYRFQSILSHMADSLAEKGVSFSSLDIQEKDGRLSAKMGLFDKKGRETALTISTAEGETARSFSIKGEKVKSGDYVSTFYFGGGEEAWEPSHWPRKPDQEFRFHNRVSGQSDSYKNAFDDYKAHQGLAHHLADKIFRGFIHDVDPETYRANRGLETPSYEGRSRRYHFPKDTPVWKI